MRYILINFFILTSSLLFAQISDDFSDGDFTTNPAWSGTPGDYIVNAGFETQLNNTIAASSYLSTAHGLATLDTKEWKFWTKQTFAPSSTNYGRVYLTSSSPDLTSDPDGFYIQLGEALSNDAVRLFKCDATVHTELLAGPLAQIAASFTIGVRVVRDNAANWSVYIDPAGGENFVLAGTINDAANLVGTHFGMLDVYTMSNSSNFYYDNIYVGDQIFDLAAPILVSATAINSNQIDVLFDEAVDQVTAETIGNYDIQPFLSATTATVDGVNPALVHIVPSFPLGNGSTYTLFTNSIEDLLGNVSGSQSMVFSYYLAETPLPGDVIVNEFMADPTPVVGLPEIEFVEIYNKSTKVFNVQNWKLGDAASNGTIQQAWLLPGEYMVLTGTSNVDSFAVATAVTSFPSLNNAGDNIVIRDDLGNTLDSMTYADSWYGDAIKNAGGYTLERINPNDPCSDQSDWTASNSASGGTPGAVNSVYNITPDTGFPQLEQLIALAPNFLEVYFTEGMDSTSLANALISTNPTLTIQNQYVLTAFPDMFTLEFVENFTPSQTYTIELQNVADCWTNATTLNGTFALPENAVAGDVVINEILFDPYTGGSDWIELYNNSAKLIDLYNWQLADFDGDTIANHKTIGVHFLLYPEEYVVVAEDTSHIIQNYPAYTTGRFIETDIPSYTNDSSTVFIIFQNQVIDKVSYTEDWHFKLLDNTDGKSLERLDPNGVSNDENNWHTAAEAIGFATPGGENSQFNPAIMNGEFSFTSDVISPDNDGFEDVLQVNYEMAQAGLVGDFTIYDDRGRKIAAVLSSELLAVRGTFTWDGVRDDNTKATIGTYVAVFEAFSLDGGVVFAKRKAFVVAGRL